MPKRFRPTLSILLALVAVAVAAPSSGAQTLADLRAALEEGGGWVPIQIREGRGRVKTVAVPTGGLLLRGYFQVWEGNRGTWSITASDPVNQDAGEEPLLEVTTRAGERVPFSRRTGMMSAVEVEVRWSEPGDTTLWVWVGLGEDPPPPSTRGSGPPGSGGLPGAPGTGP